MAQRGTQLDQANLSCSVCLDLLKDPVTIPCGHSYCMSCIKGFWDEEDQKKIHSCPQCRQAFTPRPVLVKNTMLANLVEELTKTEPQADTADPCCAGPGDVACDFCPGTKRKALKSCLQCLASYCEQHLQPHYGDTPFKKHKLIEASTKLQDNVCSRHDEVMKMFCLTDQQCICYLCPVDEHKGHDTVSAAAQRAERQGDLGATHGKIQQRIEDREKDVKVLQQEVEAINCAADKAVTDIEEIHAEMIRLIEERSGDVKQQIRSQQETEVSRAEELQEELKQEIAGLRRKDAELQQLPHIQDDIQFLHKYPSLSCLSESTDSLSTDVRPLKYFENVTAAVSETKDELVSVLMEESMKTSAAVTNVDVLLSAAEPKTRAELSKYSFRISLDPDTAHKKLSLSVQKRQASMTHKEMSYSSHEDRFTDCFQVLSINSLSGQFYGEVEYTGHINVALAYDSILRGAYRSEFGTNYYSWSLSCNYDSSHYVFSYNGRRKSITGPKSSRVGVYLDHSAGNLCFYSISSKSVTLLHRVKTTFTEPLYVGLGFSDGCVDSARLWY